MFSSFVANFRVVARSWDISGNAEIQTQARFFMVLNNLFPHEVQNGKQPQRPVKITRANPPTLTYKPVHSSALPGNRSLKARMSVR